MIEAASGGPGAPCAAAAPTPYSINMELENIVANTVLLKAREGKDGDGGFDSFSLPCRHIGWIIPQNTNEINGILNFLLAAD